MYKRPLKRPSDQLERPQQDLERQKLMVRWWRTLSGWFSRPLRASRWFYTPLLWAIKRKALSYEALSDSQLDAEIMQLRAQLRRSGLTNRLLVKSFALIREVAGRTLNMRHFDVQLLGGLAMLHGNIAQMYTGEGKTLTATLPVAAAAMAGIPVHVVTVNDYLTERDAQLMIPVYQRLGLSVGVVIQGLEVTQRRQQYDSDIVYCTSNELAFDYLKDSIELQSRDHPLHLHALSIQGERQRLSKVMLRGLHFAVVDEADSVLLDEARTPLVISGEEVPQAQQQAVYHQAMLLIDELTLERDYKILKQQRQIEFTARGEEQGLEITQDLGPFWQGRIRRLELLRQALSARHLFERDKHYLVAEEKVVIIDEHTGRLMPDRTWERGLHQLIEIKEDCPLSAPRETLASISFQNFFRHFHHLSGMTGTAEEVAGELWRVYALPVVSIATNKPNKRHRQSQQVYADDRQKWQAVCDKTRILQGQGRPVLIGTQSLLASEQLSNILTEQGVDHQILNAKQDAQEADIVAHAGDKGRVTIATSMAGRGTDIKLADSVEAAGGLHVMITGLHDSSRIDRQLQGRCARQGDQGSYDVLLSLEDAILTPLTQRITKIVFILPIPTWIALRLALWLIRRCQQRLEAEHVRLRKELLKTDERQRELLSFAHYRL
ncbi:MAG: prepilin peptidase [Oceanospirillaceae bacterium]